jgi:hypothetical protein
MRHGENHGFSNASLRMRDNMCRFHDMKKVSLTLSCFGVQYIDTFCPKCRSEHVNFERLRCKRL